MHTPIGLIVPCFNEVETIRQLLEAILAQTIPQDQLQVVIADGMSTDGTRDVIRDFSAEHPSLSLIVVDNVKRSIPAALNAAVRRLSSEIVIRLDAHCLPAPDYCQRCVELLASTGAANVGGVWEIRPSAPGWIARAIARAASHPLGAGDARYRVGGEPAEVDTVPFGAFPRAWMDRVGPFNESLLTNEDYEYNVRLRQAGGHIWFDPSIRSVYYARKGLGELSRQYWRYGYWKARMARQFPRSLRWRQVIPPALVLAILGLSGVGLAWSPAWIVLLGCLAAYGAALLLAGVIVGCRSKDTGVAAGLPLALTTMHLSWGTGFLAGLASSTPAMVRHDSAE